MKEQVLNIVKEEFSALVSKIQSDFISNFKAKQHNFLLKELDPTMYAHMVFVSSFESKSGNSIQRVAREIAKLKYGPKNVPQVINLHKLPYDDDLNYGNEQVIITNVDINSPGLHAKIASFVASKEASKAQRASCAVTHDSILELLKNVPVSDKIYVMPVSLAFFDNDELNIVQIKAGGNLDSNNAPANARKLLKIYAGLNHKKAKPYFATIYHKDGEGRTWGGSIKRYLQYPDMFLIGSAFWNKILPEGIDFEEFTRIYNEALNQINLNDSLNDMIKAAMTE